MFKRDTVLSWFSVKWSTKAHQQENFISVKFDGYGMDINSGNDKVTATNKLAFMKPFHSPGRQDCLPGVLYSSSLTALARKAISPLVILFAPLLLIGGTSSPFCTPLSSTISYTQWYSMGRVAAPPGHVHLQLFHLYLMVRMDHLPLNIPAHFLNSLLYSQPLCGKHIGWSLSPHRGKINLLIQAGQTGWLGPSEPAGLDSLGGNREN